MQIGNLNDFGNDEIRMAQDLLYTYEGQLQFCSQLTAPHLLY